MKELSIEEKAKRYDEAIKLAKDSFNYPSYPGFIRADVVFPELKKSEDERIRKVLIEAVIQVLQDQYCSNRGVSKEKVIAWLEKQGEQNHVWSEEDERMIRALVSMCDVWATSHQFYTKENKEMEAVKTWLKSLKNRVQPQPKQEWSEEDENNILFLTSIIEECFKDKKKITLCGDTVCANFTKEDVINRLKSLRPQPHWKPSDEQMNALREAVIEMGKSVSRCSIEEFHEIESLYNDLKKLKG